MASAALIMAQETDPAPAPMSDPIVVVGAGPIGVRAVQEIHRRLPWQPVVLLGAESWQPYNRVRLSAALAGDVPWADIMSGDQVPDDPRVSMRLGSAVVAIDREARVVVDAQGRWQDYRALVLALGSSPHIPNIPGTGLAGVFVLRDLGDAQQLAARRVRTRTTVVLGGGMLGLEAARAMQRSHTEVIVVEHANRLMPRQLDLRASAGLRESIETGGIRVVLGDGPAAIVGEQRVAAVRLRSGRLVACDTVVIAAGIRPNIDLARKAGLAVGQGIRVDDSMRTSDPAILAVGECAEHRERIYGIVAPGLEQAAVAAHTLSGGSAQYLGSLAATRLKVVRCPVFSMGEVGAEDLPDFSRALVHAAGSGRYRKLVLRRGRLIGALALGAWPGVARVQEAVAHERRIWPWQLLRFVRSGELWPADDDAQVQDWPAAATVCNCMGVTRGRLSESIAGGCDSVAGLAAGTGASTVCGSCRPLLAQLLGSSAPREAVRGAGPLFALAAFAALLAALLLALPGLPYADSVAVPLHWDLLWRDKLFKQISGYSLLALSLALAVLGLRKRMRRFVLGEFAGWRVVHVVIGALVVAGFVAHTGGHFGSRLNFLLASSFVGAALSGGLFALAIAREHALDPVRVRKLKSGAQWAHVLLLWPLPILLGFHIAQGYLF